MTMLREPQLTLARGARGIQCQYGWILTKAGMKRSFILANFLNGKRAPSG